MSDNFTDQGGAATSNPSSFERWLTSKVMTKVASQPRLEKKRRSTEKKRIKSKQPHVVEYFHQLDDAYSCLAVQLLSKLTRAYNVELRIHLVSGPAGDNSPEPELLARYSMTDCAKVAPYYGLNFTQETKPPSAENIALAAAIFTALNPQQKLSGLLQTSNAIWRNDYEGLLRLKEKFGVASNDQATAEVSSGNARQAELKHYSGAMFFYGGEWYWGVDRFYHLENRLIALGANLDSNAKLIMPRPRICAGEAKGNSALTLEIFPSLRSPYSSFIFEKAIELVKTTGINMVLRPVMPMVMRGVSLTRTKGLYIFADASREAHALGIDWASKTYDPIGSPVVRAFSLFPWARERGKEVQFLTAFFQAAFFDGVNTSTDKGLKVVVENAGLSWTDAQSVIDNDDWHDELEANRLAMYDFDSWGVPSFRLLDENGETLLATWGQDRLWLVAKEIEKYSHASTKSADY
jgi:2-hydroxychromene-2-carboxylate isomerase